MIFTRPAERLRFFRFAVVGTIGFVVDFGVFNIMRLVLTPDRALWASIISFMAAVFSNFLWNRFWTYPDSRSKALTRQVVQFLVVSVIGLGIRALLFYELEIPLVELSTRLLPASFPLSGELIGHNITLVVAVLTVMMWNFFANRYWTYNDVQ
jgi:putative flippase GtrA